ncbi:YigZ family protein [Alphaproteobacteria bacterium]|jgi:putative IMPACT (imprinted ancient) family translation regulator|nr:YigZ family protein [Alphaproteobacteria bacterium]
MSSNWPQYLLLEQVISDRGSRYSVGLGTVKSEEDIKALLKTHTAKKKYRTATHNTWAARINGENSIEEMKSDDGESGAGGVILNVLEGEQALDVAVVVTRWYGGKHLGSDRFRHVKNAAHMVLKEASEGSLGG